MKILITGGHLTPALAVMDHALSQAKPPSIVFVGREFARVKDKQPSHERLEVEQRNVRFIPIHTGKFQGSHFVAKFLSLLRFFPAFFSATKILINEKPDVILSFGSYVAVPIAIAGWILRIPVVTHEQTRVAGISNKIISQFSQKVLLSYKESKQYFSSSKTQVTGNPMRSSLLKTSPTKPEWFTTTSNKPIVYVTGGSQGSEILNTTMQRALPRLVREWTVIHQCGVRSKARNYLHELETVKNTLPARSRNRYIVREWLSEEELSWVYANAQVCIARSGANTVQEIGVHRIPSIFVPLPFSHHNEQLENARTLADVHGALIIPQKDLTETTLLTALSTIKANYASMKSELKKIAYPKEPAQRIYSILKTVTK